MIRFLITAGAIALLGPGHVPPGTMPVARTGAISIYAPGTPVPDTARRVVADIERWRFTPRRWQDHPAAAIRLICAGRHEICIAAPALDLYGSPAAYLRSGIAGQAARYARVLVVQSQSLQNKPEAFAAFIRAAVRQAHRASPSVRVFAGLTTSDRIGEVTGPSLLRAMRAARRAGAVGFWLNIPSAGPWCPACGEAEPGPARWALARWRWS